MNRWNYISSFINTLLIILWVYASFSKLSEYAVFTDALKRQPLLNWSIPVLSRALPFVEFVTAVLIYFKGTRMFGLLISSFLMISFTLYVLLALSGTFGNIPCSCAGIISSLRWKGHLVFNIVFTLLSFSGMYLHERVRDCES